VADPGSLPARLRTHKRPRLSRGFAYGWMFAWGAFHFTWKDASDCHLWTIGWRRLRVNWAWDQEKARQMFNEHERRVFPEFYAARLDVGASDE
jgi:hypothetical protein